MPSTHTEPRRRRRRRDRRPRRAQRKRPIAQSPNRALNRLVDRSIDPPRSRRRDDAPRDVRSTTRRHTSSPIVSPRSLASTRAPSRASPAFVGTLSRAPSPTSRGRSFSRSVDRSFSRSVDRSFVHSFIHSSVHSFVQSFIHPFIRARTRERVTIGRCRTIPYTTRAIAIDRCFERLRKSRPRPRTRGGRRRHRARRRRRGRTEAWTSHARSGNRLSRERARVGGGDGDDARAVRRRARADDDGDGDEDEDDEDEDGDVEAVGGESHGRGRASRDEDRALGGVGTGDGVEERWTGRGCGDVRARVRWRNVGDEATDERRAKTNGGG